MPPLHSTQAAPILPPIGAVRAVDQGPAPSGLMVQVDLPKSSFRLRDLPYNPALGIAGLGPAVTAALSRSKVGLTVPQDTQVRVVIASQEAPVPALVGVQAGLVVRLVGAIVALVKAIVCGILKLLGLRPETQATPTAAAQMPASGGPAAAAAPLQLSVTMSHPLKGTLNGLPAWLAHQEIKGVRFDARGQGTLDGQVKLFGALALPGLTSTLYPSAMRLHLPVLDLGLAQLALQGLAKAYPLGDQPFSVSQDPQGRLMLCHEPLLPVPSPFGAQALRLGLPTMHLEASDRGLKGHGALEADLAAGHAQEAKLQLKWQLQLDTQAQGEALSEAALLRLEGAFSAAEPSWATSRPALNARHEAVQRAALWAGLTNVTWHVGTAGHSAFAALRAKDAQWEALGQDDDEISSLSSYRTASEGSVADFAAAQQPIFAEAQDPGHWTPSTEASTPTLVGASSGSASRTPSLLTLNDEELVLDYEAGQNYLNKGSVA